MIALRRLNHGKIRNIRFTIQPSFAAIRTIGLTPVAEMAATASCIWPSFQLKISITLYVGIRSVRRTIYVSVLHVDQYPIEATSRHDSGIIRPRHHLPGAKRGFVTLEGS